MGLMGGYSPEQTIDYLAMLELPIHFRAPAIYFIGRRIGIRRICAHPWKSACSLGLRSNVQYRAIRIACSKNLGETLPPSKY
jgi:hypothetical protein